MFTPAGVGNGITEQFSDSVNYDRTPLRPRVKQYAHDMPTSYRRAGTRSCLAGETDRSYA